MTPALYAIGIVTALLTALLAVWVLIAADAPWWINTIAVLVVFMEIWKSLGLYRGWVRLEAARELLRDDQP